MTLKELSKIAGVSPATISLVLNNKAGVGDAKRQEILNLLKEYNYMPSKRTISSQPPKDLLFLKYFQNGYLVEENAGFVSTIMDTTEAECRKLGYNFRVVVSNNNLEQTLNEIDFSSIEGIFVLGTELDHTSYPVLKKIPIPYIVIDNFMPGLHCNSITMANQEMVYEAVQHLASLGHQEIGYFQSKMFSQNFEERAQGFFRAVHDLNLSYKPEHNFLVDPTMLGSYACVKQHLEKNDSVPSCCFADNDTMAIGAIKALKEFHYKIPADVCIIGFDDIRFSAINSPSISTMRVHKNLIGYLAVKNLHDSIQNSEHQNVKTQVGGEIVIRHSTILKH